uniref:Guanylate cyclase domain-containing protein n=1 Tax=Alexandrium monilatum TaxID=311494 RepID=A0A7S4RGT7_9DINO
MGRFALLVFLLAASLPARGEVANFDEGGYNVRDPLQGQAKSLSQATCSPPSKSLTTPQLARFWTAASGIYLLVVLCVVGPCSMMSAGGEPPAFQRAVSQSTEDDSPHTEDMDHASPANIAANAAFAAAEATDAAQKASRQSRCRTSLTSGSAAGVAAVAADAAATAAIAAAAAAATAADSAFMKSRFLLRFQDDRLEASWGEWVLQSGRIKNDKVYIGTFVGLVALHVVELIETLRMCGPECISVAVLRSLAKVALLCVIARKVGVCWVQTDSWIHARVSVWSCTASGDQHHHVLQCLLLGFCFFYAPAQSFPPFASWSVTEPSGPSASLAAMHHADRSLQGHTALQMQIVLIMLASWLAPTYEMLYFLWCWLVGVHIGWTVAWRQTFTDHPYSSYDIAVRALLLGAASVMAITRRYHRERGERLRFLQDLQQKATSKQIFRYLEYMMPAHVIGPMLKSPDVPIAEQVDRVSILFMMIDEFDRITMRMKPGQLLKFLNEQFAMIDQIFAANGVAKIETVREEYVACVGVLPSDKEEAEREGHTPMLTRLVRAAVQILELQTSTVRYKMGLHTGPIVAGVIGRKLPRYRLFGDTMNFAARHMQRGLVGKLQFGTETKRNLPPVLAGRVKRRGEVEMKGKGKVVAYTIEPELRLAGNTLPELPTFARRTTQGSKDVSKAQDFNTRFETALREVTATEQAQAKRWVLSEKVGFTPQMESSWLLWHNQLFVCRSLTRWVGIWVVLALVLSGFDHSFAASEALKWDHWYYEGSWRLPVFVYGRGAALALMLVLWYACDEWKMWFLNNPAVAQPLIVMACCFAALLLFLSTDALVCTNAVDYLQEMAVLASPHAPQDQMFKFVFVLLFDSMTKALAPRFFHSLVFVALAALIQLFQVILPRSIGASSSSASWFSPQGQLLFVAAAMLNAVGSHQDEQDSRARYKSKCAVGLTSARTEQLLDRLMPPLVVERLQSLAPGAPPPSHEYRHATIAQSDLCGFTRLASQRSPLEVVKFMGDIFGALDELTDLHKVHKVDTVGDAYIAGMAEAPLTATNSPASVVNFALDVVQAVQVWAKDLGVDVNCRVGVHYGQCIGGVVGQSMRFKLGAESGYQLFGALMAELEILESTAPEGQVQISRACREEVDRELQSATTPQEWDNWFFVRRSESTPLTTSKGEQHEHSEVGGVTYIVRSSRSDRRSTSTKSTGSAKSAAGCALCQCSKSITEGSLPPSCRSTTMGTITDSVKTHSDSNLPFATTTRSMAEVPGMSASIDISRVIDEESEYSESEMSEVSEPSAQTHPSLTSLPELSRKVAHRSTMPLPLPGAPTPPEDPVPLPKPLPIRKRRLDRALFDSAITSDCVDNLPQMERTDSVSSEERPRRRSSDIRRHTN